MDSSLVAENFARWNTALHSGDPRTIAALYAEKLTLIPTMAQHIISDHTGAEEYFTFFGSFLPTVRMLEERMEVISDTSYLHCGIYRFTLDRENGRADMDARFTMVWQKENDEWKILHHHSSQIPVV